MQKHFFCWLLTCFCYYFWWKRLFWWECCFWTSAFCCEFKLVFFMLIAVVGVIDPFTVLTQIAYSAELNLCFNSCAYLFFTWTGCVVCVVYLRFLNLHVWWISTHWPTVTVPFWGLSHWSCDPFEVGNPKRRRGHQQGGLFYGTVKNNLGSKFQTMETHIASLKFFQHTFSGLKFN